MILLTNLLHALRLPQTRWRCARQLCHRQSRAGHIANVAGQSEIELRHFASVALQSSNFPIVEPLVLQLVLACGVGVRIVRCGSVQSDDLSRVDFELQRSAAAGAVDADDWRMRAGAGV